MMGRRAEGPDRWPATDGPGPDDGPDEVDGLGSRLRELLRDREPAGAPLDLRRRIDRIPDEPHVFGAARAARAARAIAPWLAAAAVLVVAIVGGQALRPSVPVVGPGSSPAPAATFDPNLVGPGVAPAADTGSYWALVLITAIVLAVIAIGLRGRRGLVPVAVAALLMGWALLGSYYPVDANVWFTGPRLGLIEAEVPPGVQLQEFYIVASRDQPFVLGLGLHANGGTVPVRLDGIVSMPQGVIGPRWTALWLDADRSGSGAARGPGQPFAPLQISGHDQGVWIVGRAGQCAVGPTFDQHVPTPGAMLMPSLTLRLSVLGWPRTVDLQNPVVAEPEVDPCPPSPAVSPSPAP